MKKVNLEAIIIHKRKFHRPNIVEEAWKIYSSSGNVVVFIISNATVTGTIVLRA